MAGINPKPQAAVVAVTTMMLFAIGAPRASAQTLAQGTAGQTFDVASVKSTTQMQVPAPQVLPGGQFEMSGATLRDLIRVAYPTAHGQVDVVGGPDWVRSGRFDVVANPPVGSRASLPMLQALLAERFKLKAHAETRQGTVWSLTLINKEGKTGPDLSPSKCGPVVCTRLRIGAGPTMVGEATLADLASVLSNYPVINAPVIDRTGLSGVYNIRLRWRGDNNPNPEAGPLVFTAVEEQLGLKLERGTGAVDVIVIDEVAPLTEN